MPSIIQGYEYDIFISYRQKDNKYDGWVTEFVENLRKELEATFKDEISIYFDKNSYDGILETHNVDASLKEKLKSLVFIPIVSQTYCDIRSFAWQNEFILFNKMALEDSLGRDIKLNNGNVASRILPVKIHDLDHEDTALLEDELGGVLRSVDFIFKSPGVNRPLKPDDSRIDNLSHTFYRDQINKIANAIKEIINGLKYRKEPSRQRSSDYPLQDNNIKKSIAVLPFTDMSPARDQEYLGDGLAEEILTILSGVNELKVAGRTSSFSFKNKNLDLKTIGSLLDVENILEGSIMKSGNRIRITAQLINAQDGYHIWSQRYDREMDDIFALQDDICSMIASNLKLTLLHDNESLVQRHNVNPKAYELFLKGDYYGKKYTKEGFAKAIEYFTKALEIDPEYADAWCFLGLGNFELHGWLRLEEDKLKIILFCTQKAISIDPANTNAHFLKALIHFNCDYDWEKMNSELELGNKNTKTPFPLNFTPLESWIRAMLYGEFDFAVNRMQRAVNYDPLNIFYQFHLSMLLLYGRRDFCEAIATLENIMELGYPETEALHPLCLSYLFSGEYEMAEKYARKDYELLEGKGHGAADLIICLAAAGKNDEARQLFKHVKDTLSVKEFPELLYAKVYSHLGQLDEAFEYLEKAITENNYWLFSLKYSPEWDILRADPRFEKVIDRMRFPTNSTK
jgi:adenylate cyclase